MVAAMHVHGIANLLTLNAKDFRRFSDITVLSPDEVVASSS
jgi:predicted nucleic acid-binding protein